MTTYRRYYDQDTLAGLCKSRGHHEVFGTVLESLRPTSDDIYVSHDIGHCTYETTY